MSVSQVLFRVALAASPAPMPELLLAVPRFSSEGLWMWRAFRLVRRSYIT